MFYCTIIATIFYIIKTIISNKIIIIIPAYHNYTSYGGHSHSLRTSVDCELNIYIHN